MVPRRLTACLGGPRRSRLARRGPPCQVPRFHTVGSVLWPRDPHPAVWELLDLYALVLPPLTAEDLVGEVRKIRQAVRHLLELINGAPLSTHGRQQWSNVMKLTTAPGGDRDR